MGQTTLTGTIQAGPPSATEGTFPISTFQAVLALTPNPKSYIVAEPTLTRRISSVAYAALSGLGTTDTVTEGTFVYLRTDSPLDVRITQDIDGADVVKEMRVHGLFIQEYPSADPVTLVEVKGTATIEFFVQGNR